MFTLMRIGYRWLLLWNFFGSQLPIAYGGKRSVIRLGRGEIFDSPPVICAKGNVTQYGSTSLTGVNIEIVVSQDLSKLMINGVLILRSKNGELHTPLYNNTLDLCDFLVQPFRHRILQFIQMEIMQHSNFPSKCPILAGTYYVRNATFFRTRVPSFMPASHFRVDVNMLQGNPMKMLLETHWYGRIVKV